MNYLHSTMKRIHRDLKSSNILVTQDWVAKITDFDRARRWRAADRSEQLLARSAGALSTSQMWLPESDSNIGSQDSASESPSDTSLLMGMSTDIGTLEWLAPEILGAKGRFASYDLTVDVYSYGVVLWEVWPRRRTRCWSLCSGGQRLRPCLAAQVMHRKKPYESTGMNRMRLQAAILKGLRPEREPGLCPEALSELMQECWSAVPARRPDFHAVCRRLEQAHLPLDSASSSWA
jgi:serine/threonine protein kinase